MRPRPKGSEAQQVLRANTSFQPCAAAQQMRMAADIWLMAWIDLQPGLENVVDVIRAAQCALATGRELWDALCRHGCATNPTAANIQWGDSQRS